jgi:hypothetical protein
MKKRLLLSAIALLIVLLLLLVGCTGQPAAAKGTVEVYFTDAPPGHIYSIKIKVSSIVACMAGANESQWVTLLENPPVFDLLWAIGVNVLLGANEIPTGNYTQVRLDITEATVTLDGEQIQPFLNSGTLKLVGNFIIEAGKNTRISIDFNADKSFVKTGSGGIQFIPVITFIAGQPGLPLPSPTPTITDNSTVPILIT